MTVEQDSKYKAIELMKVLMHFNFSVGMGNPINPKDPVYQQAIIDLQIIGGANGLDKLLDKFEPQEDRKPEERTRAGNLSEIDWSVFPEELRPS